MKRYAALVLVMLMAPAFALASSKPDTMPFATDYTSSGALTPVLTWNNGQKTFVELPGRVQVTGAFVGDTAAHQFVSVNYSSPYWVIPAVARKTTLVTPLGNVLLDYQGPVPQEALAANSKKLNDDVNTLKQESATLAQMLKKRQSLPHGERVASNAQSGQPMVEADLHGMRPRNGVRQGPMLPAGEASGQGWGRRAQGANDAVASGQGTIAQFEATVVPSRWQVHVNAPITPATKIAWDYSPNWHAALESVATANGWNLKCDKSTGKCVLNPVWHVYAGSTLRTVLSNWSKAVNWSLQWDPSWDRDIAGNATFIGSYHHAVSQLITIEHNEGVPLRVKFWGGNNTVEIKSEEPAKNFGESDERGDSNGGSNE